MIDWCAAREETAAMMAAEAKERIVDYEWKKRGEREDGGIGLMCRQADVCIVA